MTQTCRTTSLPFALALLALSAGAAVAAAPLPQAQLFLHPNGCVYAPSAAQGGPVTWHRVVNGHALFPGARPVRGCPSVPAPVPGAPARS